MSDRHFDRLKGLVADARAKGAEVIEVNPAGEDFANSNTRKMPLTILRNVTDDMKAMQEEIFGPVLPVKTYKAIDEAIDYVNAHDRPLGLYYFGDDSGEREKVLTRTISGGVTVNDVVFHVSMEDLPFGGVGPSGMGSYHGVRRLPRIQPRAQRLHPAEDRHRQARRVQAALWQGDRQGDRGNDEVRR